MTAHDPGTAREVVPRDCLRRGAVSFAALTLAGLLGLFAFGSFEGTPPRLEDLRPAFLLLALACAVADVVLGGLRFQIFIHRAHPRSPLWLPIRADLAGRFVGAVTPSQSGGGPAQVFVLHRGGIPVPEALSFLLVNLISTLLFFLPGSQTQIEEEGSFRGRLSVQLAGWMMFTEHPFFGVGWDNFTPNYPEYSRRIGLDRSANTHATPHNLYIQIASEQGLVGLAWFGALSWFVFYSLTRAQKDFTAAGMEDYAGMVLAIGLGIASLYITGVFAHMTRARHWWLFWAIAMSTPYVAKRELAASYFKNDLKRWIIR